jgi:hypothetical protein
MVAGSEQRAWVGEINHSGLEKERDGTGYYPVQLSETSENGTARDNSILYSRSTKKLSK